MPQTLRPKSGERPQGFLQGHLDSLCSLYAVVNAVGHAAEAVSAGAIRPRPLFRHLVHKLDALGLLTTAVSADAAGRHERHRAARPYPA